jgi:predicted nucleic acid-binding protein
MRKLTVYIETSVLSYYTSRPSRDLVVAARQQLTHDWWEQHRREVETYISTLVIQEAEAGDSLAAKRRLEAIADFPVLELNEQVLDVAKSLVKTGPIPAESFEDALHIAVAAVNGMHFLLTWNCQHINNPQMRPDIVRVVQSFGYECPVICTPDELMGGSP